MQWQNLYLWARSPCILPSTASSVNIISYSWIWTNTEICSNLSFNNTFCFGSVKIYLQQNSDLKWINLSVSSSAVTACRLIPDSSKWGWQNIVTKTSRNERTGISIHAKNSMSPSMRLRLSPPYLGLFIDGWQSPRQMIVNLHGKDSRAAIVGSNKSSTRISCAHSEYAASSWCMSAN